MRLSVQLDEALLHLDERQQAYKVPSPAQLRAKLSGKAGGLTTYMVERLRKDFLTLMKNLKRVKTYDEAERVKHAVFKWRDHYEDIIAQIQPEIDGLLRMDMGKKSYERKVHEGWAKEFRDKQSPIWLFRSAMWDFPLTRYEKAPKWGRYYSKEELFADYQAKYKKWEQAVRRRSRAAWKWLRELVRWTENSGEWGGGGESLPIRYPGGDVKNQNIAGFSVQLRGYDPTADFSEELLGKFERGLAHYKKRAQRVMPWLIKYQLPLVLHFVENQRLMPSQSAAATYSHDHINVGVWGMASKNPERVAKTLAHEMGHHLYQNVFSQRMRDDWKQLVTGEQADLDLRKVLAMRTRDHDGDLENELKFERRIRKENPVLALQLATLMDDPRYKDLDLWSLRAIEDYLERGGNPVLKVSAKPITGYAAKNPEEAFCEAIGLLVGHGPRALLPVYRAALKILFPKLKVESIGTSSDELLEALELSEKKRRKIRASKLQYVHFTDAEGALGMVKQKKIWQSGYAAPAVYAVAVGGTYVPGVQLSKMGRAPKGRDVAILFTTDEFPDVLYPEEVLWHKKEIRVKTAKIIPTRRAIRLLDNSLVKNDELVGIPAHPSKPDWETGRVRSDDVVSTGWPTS